MRDHGGRRVFIGNVSRRGKAGAVDQDGHYVYASAAHMPADVRPVGHRRRSDSAQRRVSIEAKGLDGKGIRKRVRVVGPRQRQQLQRLRHLLAAAVRGEKETLASQANRPPLQEKMLHQRRRDSHCILFG